MEATTTEEQKRLPGLTEDEFADLYPRLRRFAAVVGSLADEPDDLVQEALTRLLRTDHMPDDAERYLRRTIVNLVIDSSRRQGRWSVRAPKLVTAAQQQDNYPSDLELLDQLRPDQRAVLWLADIEGWTTVQIADLLSQRPATIRKQTSRARAALRAHLEGAEHD